MQSPEEFCSSSTPGRMILLQWKQTVRNPISSQKATIRSPAAIATW